jgi:hypothetical protein
LDGSALGIAYVTLQGGYDNGYAGDSGQTTIMGSMSIISGQVVLDNIVIQ